MPHSDPGLDRYRQALAEKFPELAINSLEYLAEGWDSVVCRVNDRLVFRFPKRAEVARSLRLEMRLLPELAPGLPLPVPRFSFTSVAPGRAYPFAFAGYEMLPGEPLEDYPEEIAAGWWAPALGAFLAALHSFPLEQARELGVPAYRPYGLKGRHRDWLAVLRAFWDLCREKVYPGLPGETRDGLEDRFGAFLAEPAHFDFPSRLIHADLDFNHILFEPASRRLSGILDFGDVAIGDPALDLPETARPFYSLELGPAYPARRNFYRGLIPLTAVLFGLDHNDPALVDYGLYTLATDNEHGGSGPK